MQAAKQATDSAAARAATAAEAVTPGNTAGTALVATYTPGPVPSTEVTE
jgi:hypothetical protein